MKNEDKGATEIIKFVRKFDEYPDSFDDGYETFVKDRHIMNNLNSILEAEIVAAYRPANQKSDSIVGKGSVDLGCVTIYIITRSGKIAKFTNSEWGSLSTCGTI